MIYSKVQTDIWHAREKLDRELAGMTTKQLQEYSDKVLKEFASRTGVNLEVANPCEASPEKVMHH